MQDRRERVPYCTDDVHLGTHAAKRVHATIALVLSKQDAVIRLFYSSGL
jgi:hypothetical protein